MPPRPVLQSVQALNANRPVAEEGEGEGGKNIGMHQNGTKNRRLMFVQMVNKPWKDGQVATINQKDLFSEKEPLEKVPFRFKLGFEDEVGR
jgi:hypothetical protein